MNKKILLLFAFISLGFFNTNAQDAITSETATKSKIYLSSSMDGYLFSSALIDNNGKSSLGTLRFSAFFNFGTLANYDFNNTVGVFAGLNVKNIGFIEKFDVMVGGQQDVYTQKHRVYTLGIPVGIKIGNLSNKSYFIIGGGVDFPLHYKTKSYIDKSEKKKTGEWFSDQVSPIMPYVSLGARFRPGVTIKANYYPTNFFNSNYTINGLGGTVIKPYANYNVNLLILSLGFDLKYTSKY